MSKMLKEAIADAKIVRATAIANAKAILNEAFEPKLKKLINTKLKEELEDEIPEDQVEVAEDEDLKPATEKNPAVEPVAEEEEDITGATSGEEEVEEGEEIVPEPEDEVAPEVAEGDETELEVKPEDEVAPEVEEEEVPEDEKEFNIDEVIKELEDESGIEPAPEDELEEDEDLKPATEKNPAVEPVAEEKEEEKVEEDEEVEIVDDQPEVTEEEIPTEEDPEKEVYERIIMRQRSAIREQKKVISTYKNQLHEINLLNAKLLYTNKLFNTFPLSNREKMRVVESFDRTCTVREAKLVFASLHEAFASKTITESKMAKVKSTASKVIGSTKPSKETQKKINESEESEETKTIRENFKRLANIKVLKD